MTKQKQNRYTMPPKRRRKEGGTYTNGIITHNLSLQLPRLMLLDLRFPLQNSPPLPGPPSLWGHPKHPLHPPKYCLRLHHAPLRRPQRLHAHQQHTTPSLPTRIVDVPIEHDLTGAEKATSFAVSASAQMSVSPKTKAIVVDTSSGYLIRESARLTLPAGVSWVAVLSFWDTHYLALITAFHLCHKSSASSSRGTALVGTDAPESPPPREVLREIIPLL
jgi:hypothetical protein